MINYLRLSVTDKCNLNCLYCTPREKRRFFTHEEVLRYEEMVEIVKGFVALGVRSVRVTGGEPLIKKNITELMRMLKRVDGLEEIAMTTNGVYLKDLASQLKTAGLNRVNISLNTLKKEKYAAITGSHFFENVWLGVEEALKVGLHPVKLNVVVMKGINDDEILDFAQLAVRYPLCVRFIELFPVNDRSGKLMHLVMDNAEVKGKIEKHFNGMAIVYGTKGNGPAEYFKLKDSQGSLGFISGSSSNFCDQCNRVRVDCIGRVSPCLFSEYLCDLREILRNGESDHEMHSYIENVFKVKSRYNKKMLNHCRVEMSSIGG